MSAGELVKRLGLGSEVRHLVSQQKVSFGNSLVRGDVLDARAKHSFTPDGVSIGDTAVFGAAQKLVSGAPPGWVTLSPGAISGLLCVADQAQGQVRPGSVIPVVCGGLRTPESLGLSVSDQ